jgi:exodeoxyribonuclease VII small subunit
VTEPAAPTFEEAQRELDAIVQRLEAGVVPLDEALQLWERGEELYRACIARLDAAQGRIDELVRRAQASESDSA